MTSLNGIATLQAEETPSNGNEKNYSTRIEVIEVVRTPRAAQSRRARNRDLQVVIESENLDFADIDTDDSSSTSSSRKESADYSSGRDSGYSHYNNPGPDRSVTPDMNNNRDSGNTINNIIAGRSSQRGDLTTSGNHSENQSIIAGRSSQRGNLTTSSNNNSDNHIIPGRSSLTSSTSSDKTRPSRPPPPAPTSASTPSSSSTTATASTSSPLTSTIAQQTQANTSTTTPTLSLMTSRVIIPGPIMTSPSRVQPKSLPKPPNRAPPVPPSQKAGDSPSSSPAVPQASASSPSSPTTPASSHHTSSSLSHSAPVASLHAQSASPSLSLNTSSGAIPPVIHNLSQSMTSAPASSAFSSPNAPSAPIDVRKLSGARVLPLSLLSSSICLLSLEEKEYLEKTYRNLLRDKERELNHEEFEKTLIFCDPMFSLSKFLFLAFDLNRDGVIGEGDFMAAMATLTRGTIQSKLFFAFSMLDIRGKSELSKTQLREVVRAMYKVFETHQIPVSYYACDLFVDNLFQWLDVNNRGHISYDQFCKGALEDPRGIESLGMYKIGAFGSNSVNRIDPMTLKTRGFPVIFGDPNWFTVWNMMLGIRLSIEKSKAIPHNDPSYIDTCSESKFMLPKSNSQEGPVQFVEKAPIVFKKIREMNGIDDISFVNSLGPEQFFANLILGNLSSFSRFGADGGSGSFFYYSYDGKYIVKTIPADEATTLSKILEAYAAYLKANPDTTLIRFYAFYLIGQTYFVVMENVFYTKNEIHEIYDLKGSEVDRFVGTSSTVKKDVDLTEMKRSIKIGKERAEKLVAQLHADSRFLEELNIMDYSLLVGIHFRDKKSGALTSSLSTPSLLPTAMTSSMNSLNPSFSASTSTLATTEISTKEIANDSVLSLLSSAGDQCFYIRIIDLLTEYNFKKKSENFAKTLIHPSKSKLISAVPPPDYGWRFRAFMESIVEA